jgi:hypothetical protein
MTVIVLPEPANVTATDCVKVPLVKLLDVAGVIVPAVVDRFTVLVNAVTVLLLISCAVNVMLNAVPAVWVLIVPIAK